MAMNSKRLAFNCQGGFAPAKAVVSCVEGFFSVVSVNLWHYQAIMQRQAANPFVSVELVTSPKVFWFYVYGLPWVLMICVLAE